MNTSEEKTVTFNRSTLRTILIVLGILGILVSIVALVVTPGGKFNTVSLVALAVGVLGLGGAILIDPAAVARRLAGPSGRFSATTALVSIAFVTLIIAVYILILRLNPAPWDLSEGSKYTLSEASVEIISRNQEEIHAYGFFTDSQTAAKEEAEIWLSQYEEASGGRFTYEFIDPDRNPSVAQDLNVTRSGVIVLKSGERSAEATSISERDLTSAFVRVMMGEPLIIYSLTGHGEYDFTDYEAAGYSAIGARLEMSNFDIMALNLVQEGEVPEDAALLLIPGPATQLTTPEVDAIKAYMDAGGRMMLLSDPGSGGGSLGNGVLAGAFTPDGSQVVLATGGGVISLRDTETGELIREFHGHTLDVLDVAVSPDGSTLASAGADGTVRIWDIETGEQLRQLEGNLALVTRIAFSPDGAYLASVGEDEEDNVNIWDTVEYQPVANSPLTADVPLFTLAFSPDSSSLAAGGGKAGGFLYMWDITSGDSLVSQAIHDQIVFDVAFTPDGTNLLSVSLDGSYNRLDLETMNSDLQELYPDYGITAVLPLADGSEVLAVGDGSLRIKPMEGEEVTLGSHADMIWDLQVSPDGTRILSSGRDGFAYVWDVESRESITEIDPTTASDPLAEYLVTDWGLRLNEDVVIDLDTETQFSADTPVIFNISTLSPITASFDMLTFFPVARSITSLGENELVTVTPLLLTSPGEGRSWGETDLRQANLDDLDTPGPVAIGVSAENSETTARLVIFGDSDFVSNNSLQYTAFGNDRLLVNSANWLTETEDAIDLPVADVAVRGLDQPLTTTAFGLIAVASTCLLPLGLAVMGVYLFILRKRRR